ncbi:hypothetical protein DFH27DRAFT_631643 [Peziza echinospora]|nr:hypothetical protein DFH27DRAFT_631643 [Peziza echinospora]
MSATASTTAIVVAGAVALVDPLELFRPANWVAFLEQFGPEDEDFIVSPVAAESTTVTSNSAAPAALELCAPVKGESLEGRVEGEGEEDTSPEEVVNDAMSQVYGTAPSSPADAKSMSDMFPVIAPVTTAVGAMTDLSDYSGGSGDDEEEAFVTPMTSRAPAVGVTFVTPTTTRTAPAPKTTRKRVYGTSSIRGYMTPEEWLEYVVKFREATERVRAAHAPPTSTVDNTLTQRGGAASLEEKGITRHRWTAKPRSWFTRGGSSTKAPEACVYESKCVSYEEEWTPGCSAGCIPYRKLVKKRAFTLMPTIKSEVSLGGSKYEKFGTSANGGTSLDSKSTKSSLKLDIVNEKRSIASAKSTKGSLDTKSTDSGSAESKSGDSQEGLLRIRVPKDEEPWPRKRSAKPKSVFHPFTWSNLVKKYKKYQYDRFWGNDSECSLGSSAPSSSFFFSPTVCSSASSFSVVSPPPSSPSVTSPHTPGSGGSSPAGKPAVRSGRFPVERPTQSSGPESTARLRMRGGLSQPETRRP